MVETIGSLLLNKYAKTYANFCYTKIRYIIIMFKITAFFIIMLCTRIYMRVGILITCGKHLHDRIISLRGDWAHATIVAPPLFIKVSVQRQEGELSCICVNVYSEVFFVFHFIISYSWYSWQYICFVLINSSLKL